MDEMETVQRLRNIFYHARRAKAVRYDTWQRNLRLLNARSNTSTASWVPQPRDSEIYPILSAMVAWMTDQNIVIDTSPAADPNTDFYNFFSQISNDLATLLYSNWVTLDYDAQVKLCLWDALLYGTGIFKSVWDNAIDNGYGNALLRRVDPWSFYPDPNATSMDDADHFIEVHRWSYEEVIRRYPDSEALLELADGGDEDFDERPTTYSEGGGSPMTNPGALPTPGTIWNNKQSRTPRSKQSHLTVYEYWIRENSTWHDDYDDLDTDTRPMAEKHVEDQWRVIVVCKSQILMDELAEDLWSHKQHPYDRFVIDDLGEFYGIALVDHLAYPQIYINRLLTSLQQNAELIGNPIFIEPTNAGLGRTAIINKPGQRLRLQGSAGMQNKPDWLQPPNMPSFIMDLVQFWISRMESISGLSAIVKGATPTSRNSEGVISSIQEAAFVRIRQALGNLEKCLEKSGAKLADLVIDNFTDPRVMAIVGPSGEQSSIALQSRHFYGPTENGAAPLKYTLQLRAGASLPTSRQARVQEADKLYAMGTIDRQALLEAHQYPGITTVLKRIQAGIQDGTFNPPGARQRTQRKS